MKPRHILLIASLAAFTVSAFSAAGAFASDRYASQPTIMISPDQSNAWRNQLLPQQKPLPKHTTTSAPTKAVKPTKATKAKSKPSQVNMVTHGESARIKQTVTQRKSATKQTPKPRSKNKTSKKADLDPIYLPQQVSYNSSHKPGTIVIDTKQRFLYLVGEAGTARRYGVGVGKQGFNWRGSEKVSRKAKWPSWHPPQAMIKRERKKGNILPVRMEGGIANPLGARALYLGSTLYRIHGTNAPWTIGKAVSSGCIRMRNQDVEELYERVPVGTKVVVL